MTTLIQKIANLLAEDPNLHTNDLSQKLNQPEGEIICALPEQWVKTIDGQYAQTILEQLPDWGEVVTIIEKEGSIFEIKGVFPLGKSGYGYYNLNMEQVNESALHGHLKLDTINKIVFISKPFRGKESYAIAFIGQNGNVVFKVYLGRDEKRQLFPVQIEKFNLLSQQFN